MVRRLAANAVKDGKFEAMVYSFPSDLCSDGGRAINNSDPDWPESLQGKAREFYERYVKYGKPQWPKTGYNFNYVEYAIKNGKLRLAEKMRGCKMASVFTAEAILNVNSR